MKPPPRGLAFRISSHDDLIQLGLNWSDAEVGPSKVDQRLRERLVEEPRQLWVDEAAKLVLDGPASHEVSKGLVRRAHAYRHGLRERDGSPLRASRELLVSASWFQPPPVIKDEPGLTALHPDGSLYDIYDEVYFSVMCVEDFELARTD